jgi:hypothetical protein
LLQLCWTPPPLLRVWLALALLLLRKAAPEPQWTHQIRRAPLQWPPLSPMAGVPEHGSWGCARVRTRTVQAKGQARPCVDSVAKLQLSEAHSLLPPRQATFEASYWHVMSLDLPVSLLLQGTATQWTWLLADSTQEPTARFELVVRGRTAAVPTQRVAQCPLIAPQSISLVLAGPASLTSVLPVARWGTAAKLATGRGDNPPHDSARREQRGGKRRTPGGVPSTPLHSAAVGTSVRPSLMECVAAQHRPRFEWPPNVG